MRTATIAAALLVSLAACGGDGGLSLTEPHQLDLEACAPMAADLTGRWVVDAWGCQVGADEATAKCDPAALPWNDGEEIALSRSGAENYSVTIGGETATAVPSSTNGYGADLASGGSLGLTACGNGAVLVFFYADPVGGASFGDAFAAYAHRR